MNFEENLLEKDVVVSPPATASVENDPRAFDRLKYIKPLENDDYREKCGEIFVENGKYTLMCKFCHEDHENLEIFIEHMVEHLIPKEEALETDVSSDCKTDEEFDNYTEEREYKDKNSLVSNFKFAKPNDIKLEINKNFEFNKNKIDSKFYNSEVINRSVSTHHQNHLGNKTFKNYDGYGGNIEDEDGVDGNTIECVPDIGMFYDFENSCDDQINEKVSHNNVQSNWNGHIKNSNQISNPNSNWNKPNDGRFYCHMCDKSYQYSKSLKEHIDLIHRCTEKTFKCPTCDKAFSKQWKLNTHLKVHTDERPYICNICVMTFKWKKNLSRHLIRVHNVRLSEIKPEDYHLDLINTKIEKNANDEENVDSFSEHLFKSSLHGVKNDINDYPIIKNLLTDKSLNNTDTAETGSQFILNHSIKQEKPDEIEGNFEYMDETMTSPREPFSPKSTNTNNTRKSSSNFNQNKNPQRSGSGFISNGLHRVKTEPGFYEEYNQNDEIKPISRNFTQKLNTSEARRSQSAMRTSENGFVPPLVPNKDGFYSCRTCSKVYLRKDSLRAHERIHSAGLSCEFCGKNFSHRYFLERHVRTHTGEKPFRCHLCKASFVEENTLRNHIKFHIGDKKFGCQFCSKRFIKQYEKIEHERNAHNNQVPPYSCDYCSKYFNHIKTLRYHKKVCAMNPDVNKCDSETSQLYTMLNTTKPSDKNIPESKGPIKKEPDPQNDVSNNRKENFSKEKVIKKEIIEKDKNEKSIKISKSPINKDSKSREAILLQPIPIAQLQDVQSKTDAIIQPKSEMGIHNTPDEIKPLRKPPKEERDQVLLQSHSFDHLQAIQNENLNPQHIQHHQQEQQQHNVLLQNQALDNLQETQRAASHHIPDQQQLPPSIPPHPQLHHSHQQHQQHQHQHQQHQHQQHQTHHQHLHHSSHQPHPSQQYSAQQHLHHNHHHQFQLAHSLDLGQSTDQLQVEQSFQQHQLTHYHNFQHQFSQHQAHLQAATPQIQIQQYHPQQFNFQPHTHYLAAATHPQAYYPQQYQLQQHPAAHLQHPQQYEPQSHLSNQIAYVHDSFS